MVRVALFIARQTVAITLAALAYFGVRGLTEGAPEQAEQNALSLLEWERRLNLDLELAIQQAISSHESLLTLANWIYIFGHWPVVISTLVWLAVTRREQFFELRNALFISGAVGLVVFANWAVMPPRLLGPEYIDTVTIRSTAYRLLQPPALVNKYAAVPSLHFGWNLLVGIAWARATTSRAVKVAALLMPLAMAFAVVATANHWIADVFVGGVVAYAGWFLQRSITQLTSPTPFARSYEAARRRFSQWRSGRDQAAIDLTAEPTADGVDRTTATTGRVDHADNARNNGSIRDDDVTSISRSPRSLTPGRDQR
jgi:hypothetical protein